MLSMKAKYALRAMMVLARNERKLMQTKSIAKTADVPHKFLEAILSDLKNHGVISSKRGMLGGYSSPGLQTSSPSATSSASWTVHWPRFAAPASPPTRPAKTALTKAAVPSATSWWTCASPFPACSISAPLPTANSPGSTAQTILND